MSRYSIRLAHDQDCAEIARLASQLGYPASGDAMRIRLQRLLASANDVVFVAESAEGGLVGWIHGVVSQSFGLRHSHFEWVAARCSATAGTSRRREHTKQLIAVPPTRLQFEPRRLGQARHTQTIGDARRIAPAENERANGQV